MVDPTPILGLFLNDNFMQGEIPTTLGSATAMETGIFLQNNRFYGQLPFELNNLGSILRFNVENNYLGGTIPNYEWTSIQELRVNGNLFTGEMPISLCSIITTISAIATADCNEIACECCKECY